MDISEAYEVLIELLKGYGREYDCCDLPRFASVEYEELLKVAAIKPGSKVLDLGAGTGELALRASEAIGPSGSLVGIDVLEGWLEIAEEKAKKKGLSNLEFKATSMESLDLPDDAFDYAISNFAL